MLQRILPITLALCLCMSAVPNAYAWEQQETVLAEESNAAPVPHEDVKIPTQKEVYDAMIAQQEAYPEGKPWTNADSYFWHGGTAGGIAGTGAGCVAFAYILSDAAFDNLPARMYSQGGFSYSDVKVGDILRVNGDAHTVIVLRVSETGVVIAEGNVNGAIHWGRSMTKEEVEAANHYITRYPENYVDPDDPAANDPIEGGTGTLAGGLVWTLTKAGTLTISGDGAMPNFDSASEQPWYSFSDEILKIVVEQGVASIGSCAFQGSKALSVSIPDSVITIGNHAFHGSSVISAAVPAGVTAVGDEAFRDCSNLIAVTVSDGVETIGQSAFRSCKSLSSVVLPASIRSVGDSAFLECTEMTEAIFSSDAASEPVTMGNNLFARCYRLSSVVLPHKIDCISDGMFLNCLLLTSLNISQGTTRIGESAFASCSMLKTIYIPDSVTEIGRSAFSSCALTDIYFEGDEGAWNSIPKIADVPQSLKGVTIHYNESLSPPVSDHTHLWSPAWSNDSSYHWHECSAEACSITSNRDKDGYGAHSYGAWVVDQSATAYQSGSRHRTCTVCGYSQTDTIPAVGGSSSSDDSGSSSSDTSSSTTTRNPDGSTTTTKTDNRTGTVTETTRKPDGSQTVVETKKDGTITTLETDQTGNKTKTIVKPDGSSTVTVAQKDGSSAAVAVDVSGKVEAEVKLSASVVSTAQQNGEAVTLPIPKVQAVRTSEAAPVITINTGRTEQVLVEIPVTTPTSGTVAVIVRADGTEEIIKTSVPTADGVALALPDGTTVKVVDNSMNFTDVSPQNWAADAIHFVAARGLFTGTTESTFSPDAPMTRAMLMVVLARFHGVDISGGTTWYEKSVEWAVANGVSDGSNPNGSITREQLVTMLWRYAGSPNVTGTLSNYTDAGQVSVYAQDAMYWAVENGIISGFGDKQLGPRGQATRAQVAQMLRKYIEQQKITDSSRNMFQEEPA